MDKSPGLDDLPTGSVIKVYLGYADMGEENASLKDNDIAFTGIIDEVSRSFKKISITAFSNAYKIIFKMADPKKFNGDDWEKKDRTSKDIIEKLLDGKLEIDKIDTGMSFKAFKANEKQSIYDHIKTLADYNGFNFFISRDGKVRVIEKSTRNYRFRYGHEILENSITKSKPAYDSVEVELIYKKGGDAGRIISYMPVAGSSLAKDKKTDTKTIECGWVDNEDSAKKIAENILSNNFVTETGELKVLGDTNVDLCDTLTISFDGSSPGGKELGFMQRDKKDKATISKITHKFGKKSGFTTTIGWKKMGEVAPSTVKK